MCWLRIRQLTVAAIAEYADMSDQPYWKRITYPRGIGLRETLGIRRLAKTANWSSNTASFGCFFHKPFPLHPQAQEEGQCLWQTLLSKQFAGFCGLSYTDCRLWSCWSPPAKQGSAHTGQHRASSLTSDNSILKKVILHKKCGPTVPTSDHQRSCCPF